MPNPSKTLGIASFYLRAVCANRCLGGVEGFEEIISIGSDEGDSLRVIGRLLGHSKVATTQRYAHLTLDPVKDAAERIRGRIAAKLLPGSDGRRRVMRIPLTLPVDVVNRLLGLAEGSGQSLDELVRRFLTEALDAIPPEGSAVEEGSADHIQQLPAASREFPSW